MNLAEKIISYKPLIREIQDLEEKKKVLSKEILAEMPSKKMNISGYKAFRYTRLSIRITLEQARLLNATKMEEQVDKTKIKELHSSGQMIEGVRETPYLVVTKSKSSLEPLVDN